MLETKIQIAAGFDRCNAIGIQRLDNDLGERSSSAADGFIDRVSEPSFGRLQCGYILCPTLSPLPITFPTELACCAEPRRHRERRHAKFRCKISHERNVPFVAADGHPPQKRLQRFLWNQNVARCLFRKTLDV